MKIGPWGYRGSAPSSAFVTLPPSLDTKRAELQLTVKVGGVRWVIGVIPRLPRIIIIVIPALTEPTYVPVVIIIIATRSIVVVAGVKRRAIGPLVSHVVAGVAAR